MARHPTPRSAAARARDPETPPEELEALVEAEPEAVLANPALSLLALENPAVYQWLTQQARIALLERELRAGLARLEAPTRRLFAADCVERVLPLYESLHPGDLRPRAAVEAARRYARRDAT